VTRGFRAPDFSELFLNNTHAGGRVRVLGNTELRPEQSWSYTAGALFAPGDRLRLEARLFENALDDMILSRLTGREGIASIYRYVNVGSAKIRGGLISIDSPLSRRVEVHGSYQYLFTRDFSAGIPLICRVTAPA
jgi:outer membrane receptor for ferrienterochelin and colicins